MIAKELVTLQIQIERWQPEVDYCPDKCAFTNEFCQGYCEDCPVAYEHKIFRECAEDVIARIPGADEYALDDIIQDYNAMAALDASVGGKGTKPEWTTTQTKLVQILRTENRFPKRQNDYEIAQEMKKLKNKG